MKVIANTKFETRTFDTVEDCAKKLDVSADTVTKAIESGDAIPVGIRYWYVDEAL